MRLHVGATSHLLRETMNSIEARLDPEKFFRIHRSRIVNMERIQEMQPWLNGEYAVVLRNGTRPSAAATSESSRNDWQGCRLTPGLEGLGVRSQALFRELEQCVVERDVELHPLETTCATCFPSTIFVITNGIVRPSIVR